MFVVVNTLLYFCFPCVFLYRSADYPWRPARLDDHLFQASLPALMSPAAVRDARAAAARAAAADEPSGVRRAAAAAAAAAAGLRPKQKTGGSRWVATREMIRCYNCSSGKPDSCHLNA